MEVHAKIMLEGVSLLRLENLSYYRSWKQTLSWLQGDMPLLIAS